MKRLNKKLLPVIFLVVLALVLTACGRGGSADNGPQGTQEKPQEQPVDTLVLGQQVFEVNCAGCHSIIKDEKRVGPSLAGISGSVLENGQQATAETLKEVIQKGTSTMPGNMIRDESDLEALIQYLLSL